MSIKDFNVEVWKPEYAQPLPRPALQESRQKFAWLKHWPGKRKDSSSPRPSSRPLWLCLAIALVVRAWLVIHTQGFIDGDEALVGIQAQHILHGELPVYFYNQPYMGSLEAYLMAAIFAIAGSSVWALRAEPVLLSLVIVWLTWKLAGALADRTQLPLYARQWFMTIAALLAAIPPLYDTVLEMRALGGYVEIFILMLLLLLSSLKLTDRRAAGAPKRELAWCWAGSGFIAGLGFWVNPLIIYGMLAAALWIGWDFIKAWRDSWATALTTRRRFLRFIAALKQYTPALAAIPALLIGAAPALTWGASHQWENITYLLQLGGNTPLRPGVQAHYPTRLSMVFGLTRLYTTCVGPRVIGGALPGENPMLGLLHAPMLLLSGSCILVTIVLAALSLLRSHPSGYTNAIYRIPMTVRRLTGLPLVFAASTTIIFCATRTAAIGLWSCQYDLAGRYATPLMLVLPFFYAAVFTAAILLAGDSYKTAVEQAAETPEPDMSMMGSATMAREEAIDGRLASGQWQGSPLQDSATGLRLQSGLLGLLVGFLLVSTLFQACYYGLTDPGSTFQSPYCTLPPANNDAIITYMQREHIHYAWANNWIAYPIVFKTQGSIIISDPLPIIRHIPILDRIPAYTDAVQQADRPSLLVFVKRSDPRPQLLRWLDAQNTTYRVARFPAQEGTDVLVVTPLNRTVAPFDPGVFFSIFICSRDS